MLNGGFLYFGDITLTVTNNDAETYVIKGTKSCTGGILTVK